MITEDYEYLGDGVYASWDGFGIELVTGDLANIANKIYIEPDTMNALNEFYKRKLLEMINGQGE